MCGTKNISFHDLVKRQILEACNLAGLQAVEEYRGIGWRADVFVIADNRKFAFEVQTTPQCHPGDYEFCETSNK